MERLSMRVDLPMTFSVALLMVHILLFPYHVFQMRQLRAWDGIIQATAIDTFQTMPLYLWCCMIGHELEPLMDQHHSLPTIDSTIDIQATIQPSYPIMLSHQAASTIKKE
jgi:hypothetical protein